MSRAGQTRLLALAAPGLWLLACGLMRAEDKAPATIADSVFTVSILGGHPPFSSQGSYRFLTSVTGTGYVMLGPGPLNSGTYTYLKTGPDSATAILTEAIAGGDASLQLSFASPGAGTLSLTNSAGYQTGAFTLARRANAKSPQLFLGELGGGTFQGFLSGQPGFKCVVETSGTGQDWQALTNIALAEITAGFRDGTAGASRFYRARLDSTALAPADLTNQSLNLNFTEGALPLATNGVCQWLADTNGNVYRILGSPTAASSSGSYTYTRTGPDTGLIACQDSVAGNLQVRLAFNAPQSGWIYASNGTGFEAGTFTLADGPVPFLGRIRFAADTARRATVDLAADGSTTSLSVTNVDGWIWRLDFPADAVLTPWTVTMSSVTNLDASGAWLPVAAGVQLTPDGLRFSDGVTLTVTPPKPLGPHATLLLAAHDGGALELVATTNQANSYSTTLFHFSSAAMSDPSEPDWDNFVKNNEKQAAADYENAKRQVQALKRVIVVPPEPPDYEGGCNEDDDVPNAYEKALFAKEDAASEHLLASAKALASLYTDPVTIGQINNEALEYARALVETAEYRKVEWLLTHYRKNPKKFLTVASVALSVARRDGLAGGPGRPDWLQTLQGWAQEVLDYYFDQVGREHRYSKAPALIPTAHRLAQLGGTVNDSDFLARLDDVLTFGLSLDIDVQIQSAQIRSLSVKGQGEMTLRPVNHAFYEISGSDTFNFLSGSGVTTVTVAGQVVEADQTLLPGTFVPTASLGLNPCASSPKLSLFVKPEDWPEQWIVETQGQSFPLAVVPGDLSWGVTRLQEAQPAKCFEFPLADGQVQLVAESVSSQPEFMGASIGCQIQFRLQHTPRLK